MRADDCRESPAGLHEDLDATGICTWCNTTIVWETREEREQRKLWQDPASGERADHEDTYYDS